MAKHTFEEWFQQQFGRRPTTIDDARLTVKIRGLREELAATERQRQEGRDWDEKWRAARYAWTTWQDGGAK